MRRYFLICILLLLVIPTIAQDEAIPAFETVEITASDDLVLIADLYIPDMNEEPAPAVILFHMLNAQRGDYEPLIPYLLEMGYVVLNADMRGHGDTEGARDWDLAIEDTQLWFDWLREQERVDASRTAIIGASIGSNVALIACGNDADCVTAIALSPGENYSGVMPGDAVANGLNALLIASHDDRSSANSVRAFFAEATGSINARLYAGNAHGTRLFDNQLESVAHAITAWLDEKFAMLSM